MEHKIVINNPKRVILITGAASGMGQAAAQLLVDLGAQGEIQGLAGTVLVLQEGAEQVVVGGHALVRQDQSGAAFDGGQHDRHQGVLGSPSGVHHHTIINAVLIGIAIDAVRLVAEYLAAVGHTIPVAV